MIGKNNVWVNIGDMLVLIQDDASIISLSDSSWSVVIGNAYNTVALSGWEKYAKQFENGLERVCRPSQDTVKVLGLK